MAVAQNDQPISDPTYVEIVSGGVGVNPAAPVLGAGENHVGEIHGAALPVTVSPTISAPATPYTALDNIGGKQTLAGAVRISGGTSILQSVFVLDRANQKAALEILILDSDPNDGSTVLTDNLQMTLVAADISRVKRRISIAAADYATVDHGGTDFAIAEISALSKLIKAASGTTLYAIIYTSGTPTYTAGALSLTFGFLPVN